MSFSRQCIPSLPVIGKFTLPATALRASLGCGVLAAALTLPANEAHALLLIGPDGYRNLQTSSVFGTGFEAPQLVDNDLNTAWVLGGAIGANPQGRDEGWFSFELEKDFIIKELFFAPRSPSGSVDGVDKLQMWTSLTPFQVDVTDATSTSNFLGMNLLPSFQVEGFAPTTSLPYTYSTGSLASRYVLVRLLNSTDTRSDRNMGARMFQVAGAQMVPGPLPVFGVASAFFSARRLRRRCRVGSV